MGIESEINPIVSMQLKVISDELYEILWELQPSPATIRALKAEMDTLVDRAWEEYNQTVNRVQPACSLKLTRNSKNND